MTRPATLTSFLAGLVLVGTIYALADDGAISGSARVIDGDTLEIDSQRIRLWGIDAPERNTIEGPAATAHLRRITHDTTVTCYQKEVDRYKRIVAQCFVDGRDIARELVKAGHARDMPRYSKGYYGTGQQTR
jgi:micrococcal nuclease